MSDEPRDPLEQYRDELRDRFAEIARRKFDELTQASGVDIEANRTLVDEIRRLGEEEGTLSTRKTLAGLLMWMGFILPVVGFVAGRDPGSADPGPWYVPGIFVGVIVLLAAVTWRISLSSALDRLRARIADRTAVAWEQMRPLNDLFDWHLTARLIKEAAPMLRLDRYVTVDRMASLQERPGWDGSFADDKSILCVQSGEIDGNPFVFGQYLGMTWGQRTYEGTKDISWTEWVTDVDGRRNRVSRSETLRAFVTKPEPVYGERKFLAYGHDAVPDLSFSRQPSGLTGETDGLFGKLRMRNRLNELRDYSRNLDDDSQFTLMSNHEFETWFHAKDRDDEVGFRMLFTPVAQTQMLALMKDDKIGYGDDFSFIKRKQVNILLSKHLDESTIETDPERLRGWDYDEMKERFKDFNERYFKDIYFSIAPLLAIPAYRQRPSSPSGRTGRDRSCCVWEHEAMANYHGEARFAHPDCVTRSILKTRVCRDGGIAVTAYGYAGVPRIDVVSVYGGDGRRHGVSVPWMEYVPVNRTGMMRLSESTSPSESFRKRMSESPASAFRRSIASYVEG